MRTTALLAGIIVLGLAVAGCGSDAPTVSPEAAQWADDYCQAAASFYTPVAAAVSSISAQDLATPAQARTALAPVSSAATTFASDMNALTPPATEGATHVKTETDDLAATITKYVARADAALDAWASGKQSQASALSVLGSELRATGQVISQTTANVRTLDTEIDAAVSDSSTCQSLIDTLGSPPVS